MTQKMVAKLMKNSRRADAALELMPNAKKEVSVLLQLIRDDLFEIAAGEGIDNSLEALMKR